MKTYVTYGFFMTLGGMVLTLALYFLGFHSEVSKMATADWISKIGLLVICVTCIVLGTKARRSEVPVTEEFGYGRALLAGFLISVFGALFGIVTNYLYFHVINPGFIDLIIQAVNEKMEAAGRSSAQIEQAEKGVRMMMNPVISAIFVVLITLFWGTIISLITSAFLKRPAVEDLNPPALP